MNVLFLSARFYPSRGGVQKHVYEAAQELIKKGHHVTVLTETFPSDADVDQQTVSTYTIDSIDVVACNFGNWGFAKKFRIWMRLWSLREYFLKADVVHCHDVFFWYLPYRFLFPWIKVFTTFHGYEGTVPPRWQAVVVRRLSNFLSRGSIHIGNYIQKWYGTRADVTLYGGVSTTEFVHHTGHNEKRSGPFRVAFIGRLAGDIGSKTYSRILEILTTSALEYELDVCGDGPDRALFQKYGTVHGMVTDVDHYIRNADIVFASSYLAILEALSCGKPVVAIYENALKHDYLLDTPFVKWLIVGDDPKVLADMVQEALDGRYTLPDIDELDHYLKTVSWEKIAYAYEELWKK